MSYWRVPGDLDYNPDTETKPEIFIERDVAMRCYEIHVYLPKLRPLMIRVSNKGKVDVLRLEEDKSITKVLA